MSNAAEIWLGIPHAFFWCICVIYLPFNLAVELVKEAPINIYYISPLEIQY